MELKKLAPWNWFKDEEESAARQIPVNRLEQSSNQPCHQQIVAGRHFAPLIKLHEGIDRIFDNTFRNFGLPTLGLNNALPDIIKDSRDVLLKPRVDIEASTKAYTITVEVPGVDKDHLELELLDNTLAIKGEKKQEAESNDKGYYRVERSYGSFQRVLSLPEDADQDNIDAIFRDGVLTITLPLKQTASRPEGKVININSATSPSPRVRVMMQQ